MSLKVDNGVEMQVTARECSSESSTARCSPVKLAVSGACCRRSSLCGDMERIVHRFTHCASAQCVSDLQLAHCASVSEHDRFQLTTTRRYGSPTARLVRILSSGDAMLAATRWTMGRAMLSEEMKRWSSCRARAMRCAQASTRRTTASCSSGFAVALLGDRLANMISARMCNVTVRCGGSRERPIRSTIALRSRDGLYSSAATVSNGLEVLTHSRIDVCPVAAEASPGVNFSPCPPFPTRRGNVLFSRSGANHSASEVCARVSIV